MILSLLLIVVRLHAAWRAPLLDCDEVYNYWEPLNLLMRHFGKQTWEYDPNYALRSYAYLWPWTIFKYLTSFGDFDFPPFIFFYAIRFVLALLFILAELKLASQLKFLNKSTSSWFLLAQIVSPGMYNASISLLPNSTALLFTILSTSYMLRYFHSVNLMKATDADLFNLESSVQNNQEKEKKITEADAEGDAEGDQDLNVQVVQSLMKIKIYTYLYSLMTKNFTLSILFISIAGFVCWPFSLVLVVPFVFYALINSIRDPNSNRLKEKFSSWSTISTLILTGLSCAFFVPYFISQLDFLFYKRQVIFFYNLVSYNVLNSNDSTGPHIFGTEDVVYYIKNLLLNFHLVLPIALFNLILLPNWTQLITYKLPIIIWCVIFCSQPHKEERFMYPIYHLISISFAQFMSCPTFKSKKLFKLFKLAFNLILVPLLILLGSMRINNVINGYSAPQLLFQSLSSQEQGGGANICIGREWYHYPSSFFLNSNQRLKFTKSNFNGLLPADFLEDGTGTFNNINEFNNENKSQPQFLFNPDKCDYYIDSTYPTSEEDDFKSLNEDPEWAIVHCEPMINTQTSHGVDKVLGVNLWVDSYVINPWLNLQEDLSVIELNRKLMQMYGIERDGRLMFNGLYDILNPFWGNVQAHLGERNQVDLCLFKREGGAAKF